MGRIGSGVRVRGSFQKHSTPGLSHGSKEGGGGYGLGILSAEGGGTSYSNRETFRVLGSFRVLRVSVPCHRDQNPLTVRKAVQYVGL